MKKIFKITETVIYHHQIEVEVEAINEEVFEDFAEDVGEDIDNGVYEDKGDILNDFCELFGKNKVAFVEDGSPEVEIE